MADRLGGVGDLAKAKVIRDASIEHMRTTLHSHAELELAANLVLVANRNILSKVYESFVASSRTRMKRFSELQMPFLKYAFEIKTLDAQIANAQALLLELPDGQRAETNSDIAQLTQERDLKIVARDRCLHDIHSFITIEKSTLESQRAKLADTIKLQQINSPEYLQSVAEIESLDAQRAALFEASRSYLSREFDSLPTIGQIFEETQINLAADNHVPVSLVPILVHHTQTTPVNFVKFVQECHAMNIQKLLEQYSILLVEKEKYDVKEHDSTLTSDESRYSQTQTISGNPVKLMTKISTIKDMLLARRLSEAQIQEFATAATSSIREVHSDAIDGAIEQRRKFMSLHRGIHEIEMRLESTEFSEAHHAVKVLDGIREIQSDAQASLRELTDTIATADRSLDEEINRLFSTRLEFEHSMNRGKRRLGRAKETLDQEKAKLRAFIDQISVLQGVRQESALEPLFREFGSVDAIDQEIKRYLELQRQIANDLEKNKAELNALSHDMDVVSDTSPQMKELAPYLMFAKETLPAGKALVDFTKQVTE